MRVWNVLAVGACLAPLVLAGAPANALTARQEAALGQGVYLTSKGIPEGYRGYGYRRVYGYPAGWRRHSWRGPRYRDYDY